MTRCHDHQCGERTRCARWVQRETGDQRTVHAMTLKPAWLPHAMRCPHYRWQQAIRVDDLPERGPAGWTCYGWFAGIEPRNVPLSLLHA